MIINTKKSKVTNSNDAVFLLGDFKPNDQIQVYDVVGR